MMSLFESTDTVSFSVGYITQKSSWYHSFYRKYTESLSSYKEYNLIPIFKMISLNSDN